MRVVFRVAWSRWATGVGRALGRAAGLRPSGFAWTKLAGPYFGNAVGTLVHSGRSAQVTVEGTDSAGELVEVIHLPLTAPTLDID
jgi:hypothetical protein